MTPPKILDGNDKAHEEGFPSYRERLARYPYAAYRWNGSVGDSQPVTAFIDFGRWVAMCECGGAEYVTPDDPIFFCHTCGNKSTDGSSRPVLFPEKEERKKIEEALLSREVEEPEGLAPTQAAMQAKPKHKLCRNWRPGTTVESIHLLNARARVD